jgi:uncharacterized membrane protein (DUF2068 family)
MSHPAHKTRCLPPEARRVRYLKLIALFKIAKGLLLLVLGVSVLLLDARSHWMDALLKWIADEILLQHSRAISALLHNLEAVLASGTLAAMGLLALLYAALFFTEGIGVYMQQRWAAWLMLLECALLIPIELHHLWHRPGFVGALILLANCFIVWFLYCVLKREGTKAEVGGV